MNIGADFLSGLDIINKVSVYKEDPMMTRMKNIISEIKFFIKNLSGESVVS